jgi:hypothetical protein
VTFPGLLAGGGQPVPIAVQEHVRPSHPPLRSADPAVVAPPLADAAQKGGRPLVAGPDLGGHACYY